MNIIPIPAFNDNYIWLGYDPQTKQCFVVDPGDAKPVLKTLAQLELNLSEILITHHHDDHTGGVKELVELTHATVYGPANSKYEGITVGLADGNSINLASVKKSFQILAVPGHTLDHIAYCNEELVFCGDTLFSAGCGRLFEGTADEMYLSLTKLAHLPPNTLVYCAHEYTMANLKFSATVEPRNLFVQNHIKKISALRSKNLPSLPSTIGDELQINPFLRCQSLEIIENIKEKFHVSIIEPSCIFKELRKWKDNFS